MSGIVTRQQNTLWLGSSLRVAVIWSILFIPAGNDFQSKIFSLTACRQPAACYQYPFALQTLTQHGLPNNALRLVFQAIDWVTSLKLGGDFPQRTIEIAWKHLYEGRQNSVTELTVQQPSLVSVTMSIAFELFAQITDNSQHLLHPLLPLECEQHYSFRSWSHNFQLSDWTSVTNDKNFSIRMPYIDNLY